MPPPDIASLSSHILWAAFAVSLAFGAVLQKTHFCTMGALSDIVNIGSWERMQQWMCAVGVAIAGYHALVLLGWLDPSKTLYASNKVLIGSALIGGFMFGIGMVFASGCGSKTLVRIGGGSLKSLVVFVVMGVAAFATLKGITAVLRVATIEQIAINNVALNGLQTWTIGLFDLQNRSASSLLGLSLGMVILMGCLSRPAMRDANNLIAGLGVGAAVVAMWAISGHWGYVPEHPDTLAEAFLRTNSGRAEALSFVAPVAYTLDWLMFYSDKSKVLTLGVVSVAGVVVGSWLLALSTRSFRWEGFRDARDTGFHLVGAVLMGVGGVSAMGCTVGQGLSGLSTLGFTSILAVVGIVLGGLVALHFQVWLMDRETD